MMKKILLFILTITLLFCLPQVLFAKTPTIVVWNYYLAPPFVVSNKEGLAQDFVNLINKKSMGKFNFELRSVPRARLNRYLKKEQQGIVLFVNWVWMGKNAKQKYLWTNQVLKDQNEIISSLEKKIVFQDPLSLKGLIFGAIRGRKYKGLESLFISNEIQRYNVAKEKQIIEMLLRNRVDVTSQPRTLILALAKEMGVRDKLFFSPKPLFSFTRHIMITSKLEEVSHHLNSIVDNISKDEEWNKILYKYDLLENNQ